MVAAATVPALLPVLSRGKHRGPRRGACFMEYASVLAGERWSDHPACTHPLLAAVARQVNDCISDDGRQRLARLVPDVVGMTGDDPELDAWITLRCATAALPVASAERQCALAVSTLVTNRMLAALDGRPAGELTGESRAALEKAPAAWRWAERFSAGVTPSVRAYRRYAAPSAVRDSVEGIAWACAPDPDDRLYRLLAGLIRDWPGAREHVERETPSRLTAPVPRRR
jgi:hypothetical protein